IGTPAYMAPEQLRGQPLDCRADLYALGVTLYMMLAGRPPFEGPSLADYFRQHLEQEPPPLEELSPDIDPGLAAVLRKSLAKWPDERYSTPAEMLAALRPFSVDGSGETIVGDRTPPRFAPTPTPTPTRHVVGTPQDPTTFSPRTP